MRLGLNQVGWLKSKHPIARRRRRAIRKIFEDAKQQTLQLLFPGQDLGFVYSRGWLAERDKSAPVGFAPFVFKRKLEIGGRMPHLLLSSCARTVTLPGCIYRNNFLAIRFNFHPGFFQPN